MSQSAEAAGFRLIKSNGANAGTAVPHPDAGFIAVVGGGVVSVVANGSNQIVEIKIAPEVIDPDDVEMLQDLVISAVNEALRKADEMVQTEMSKVTGALGTGMPGGMFR